MKNLGSTNDPGANQSSSVSTAHRSRARRLVYALAAVVIVALAVEAASFAGLWILNAKPFTPAAMSAQRQRLTGEAGGGQSPPGARSQTEDGAGAGTRKDIEAAVEGAPAGPEAPFWTQINHPFLGSVFRRSSNPAKISEFGFYGQGEPIRKRAPGKLIIAMLGGSVAMGFIEPADLRGGEVLTRELKKHPALRDKEIIFVNLALSGYKQPQQLMTLNYFMALGAQFDIVINLDGFNDVVLHATDNHAKHISPYYPRTWQAKVATLAQPELRRIIGRVSYLEQERRSLARRVEDSAWRFSPTINLIWLLRDRRLGADIASGQREFVEAVPPAESFEVTGPSFDAEGGDEVMAELAAIWARCSKLIDAICNANGMMYFHFLQPNQYDLGSKPMGAAERRVALGSEPYRVLVSEGYPRLKSAGARMAEGGMRFADMTRVFTDLDEPLYIDNCCHFNTKGYEILATVMAEQIAGAWAGEQDAAKLE